MPARKSVSSRFRSVGTMCTHSRQRQSRASHDQNARPQQRSVVNDNRGETDGRGKGGGGENQRLPPREDEQCDQPCCSETGREDPETRRSRYSQTKESE